MVSFRTLILIALAAAAGCKSKQEPAKKTPAPQPAPTAPTAWREHLPELADGKRALALDQASGVVAIAADGSLSLGKPGAEPLAAATPIKLDGLEAALDLPPVAPRRDADFAAVEGATPGLENPTDIVFAKLGHPALSSGSPAPPHRLTSAFAIAHPNDVSGGIVVIADANAPAAVLVDVLAKVGGFVAVRSGKDLGAVPLAIDRHPPAATRPDQRWHEVQLVKTIEKVPATDALDVLVQPQTTVQDLITAIGALRAAKVEAIGLGRAPAAGSPDAAARDYIGPRVTAWNFAVVSPEKLDAAPIRTAFDATLEPMQKCYASALMKQAKSKRAPQTAQIAFALPPGKKPIVVDGVDAAVAKCVEDAVRAGSFTTPSSAAQVEVRLSFTPE